MGDLNLIPGFGRSSWRRAWQPTPVFLSAESPLTEEPGGLQSMSHKESDMAEQLSRTQPRIKIESLFL